MNLKAWWRERSSREQLVLIGGMAVLILVSGYLLLEPAIQQRHGFAQAIPGLRADLTWMQAHSEEMRGLLKNTRQGGSGAGAPLTLAVVQTTLRESGLLDLVEDLRATGQSGISVNITDVAFSDLVQFLYMIKSRSQGSVETAEITRSSDNQGIVTANIVLRGAGR